MRKHYDMIIVMPVGPGSNPEYIQDTLVSIRHYVSCSYMIILVDDSHEGIAAIVNRSFPEILVLNTPYNHGGKCGLYLTLSIAYKYAVEHYRFDSLLKIDTDALVIGKDPQESALALFKQSKTGMAGQYPNEYNGQGWNIAWPKQRIINGTTTWKFFRRPFGNFQLRRFYKKALKNGYKTGESVFGGSYFMSEALLIALERHGLLPNPFFKSLNLEEDHLFSLLTKSLGFDLGDLASGDKPFACAWKELPDSPEVLFRNNKKIIHSTRNWKELKEEQIRRYFGDQRAA